MNRKAISKNGKRYMLQAKSRHAMKRDGSCVTKAASDITRRAQLIIMAINVI